MTAGAQRRGEADLPNDEVRACLALLLASPSFLASPRRRQLLSYIVEQTLAGRADRLKAFDLAIAVLGRDERFDPQNDPIVRIEFGRLRRDLDHYYESAGAGDAIRISIPKGHYIPAFSAGPASPAAAASDSPPPPPPVAKPATSRGARRYSRLGVALGVGCVLLLAVGLLGWRWLQHRSDASRHNQALGPAVIVLPLETLSGDEGSRLLANGLTHGLIDRLMRFDGIEVFDGLPAAQGGASLPAAAEGLPAYLITGTVERAPDLVQLTARLTERSSGKILWSQTYSRTLTTAGIFEVEADLSAAIVGRLAQGYGVIAADTAKQLRRGRPETLFAYDCVQRAFQYRRSFDRALYPEVRACLEESVRRDPNYATGWAMLAFAHMDASRFGLIPPAATGAEIQAGLEMARRAVELAPDSVTSQQSLAALQFTSGDLASAEVTQRRAISLNPHNPESLAQLGWRLAALGRAAEGGALLQEAVAYSVSPPRWYYSTLALAHYLNGSLAQARDAAELGRGVCCGGSLLMLALAETSLGRPAAAAAAYAKALEQAPLLRTDPPAFFRNLGLAEDVAHRLMADIAHAQLIPSGPEGR